MQLALAYFRINFRYRIVYKQMNCLALFDTRRRSSLHRRQMFVFVDCTSKYQSVLSMRYIRRALYQIRYERYVRRYIFRYRERIGAL